MSLLSLLQKKQEQPPAEVSAEVIPQPRSLLQNRQTPAEVSADAVPPDQEVLITIRMMPAADWSARLAAIGITVGDRTCLVAPLPSSGEIWQRISETLSNWSPQTATSVSHPAPQEGESGDESEENGGDSGEVSGEEDAEENYF